MSWLAKNWNKIAETSIESIHNDFSCPSLLMNVLAGSCCLCFWICSFIFFVLYFLHFYHILVNYTADLNFLPQCHSTTYGINGVFISVKIREELQWNQSTGECMPPPMPNAPEPIASTKSDLGFKPRFLDWSESGFLPVDSFPCWCKSFGQVSWKAASDHMTNANNLLKSRISQCWKKWKSAPKSYLGPDHHQKLISSSDW